MLLPVVYVYVCVCVCVCVCACVRACVCDACTHVYKMMLANVSPSGHSEILIAGDFYRQTLHTFIPLAVQFLTVSVWPVAISIQLLKDQGC